MTFAFPHSLPEGHKRFRVFAVVDGQDISFFKIKRYGDVFMAFSDAYFIKGDIIDIPQWRIITRQTQCMIDKTRGHDDSAFSRTTGFPRLELMLTFFVIPKHAISGWTLFQKYCLLSGWSFFSCDGSTPSETCFFLRRHKRREPLWIKSGVMRRVWAAFHGLESGILLASFLCRWGNEKK